MQLVQTDRELWDTDLDWYLNVYDSTAGQRSSFGASLDAQRDLATTTPAKWGWSKRETPDGVQWWRRPQQQHTAERDGEYTDGQVKAFSRGRKIHLRWCRCSQPVREVLSAYYLPRQYYPPGVKGRLGEFAAVALLVSEDLIALADRCQFPTGWERDKSEAEDVVRRAHRQWSATR